MTEREAQIEALWIYEISREKILKRIVNKGLMTQAEADGLSERMLWTAEHWQNSRFSLISTWWKDAYQWLMPHPLCFLNENCQRKENLQSKLPHPKLDELIHTVHSTSTTLTPSLWISTTHAIGMKTSHGKGGGTTAHPEIAEMFRAWLFPKFMLELIQWYRVFQHDTTR